MGSKQTGVGVIHSRIERWFANILIRAAPANYRGACAAMQRSSTGRYDFSGAFPDLPVRNAVQHLPHTV